jgi:hypothetical protein
VVDQRDSEVRSPFMNLYQLGVPSKSEALQCALFSMCLLPWWLSDGDVVCEHCELLKVVMHEEEGEKQADDDSM